jgi:aromatic-L-amino-acid/L-tryptophan decarboxylase
MADNLKHSVDLSKLSELERSSARLEPTSIQWQQWCVEIEGFLSAFLFHNQTADAFTSNRDINFSSLKIDREALPQPIEETLKVFQQACLDDQMNPSSGRFFGYVPGGGMPAAAIGDFVAALTNRYVGMFEASPGAATIENEVIDWLTKEFELPQSAWGTLTSGGTNATQVSLIVARDRFEMKDFPNLVIYHTEQVHQVMEKSLAVIGLRGITKRLIAVNEKFQMKVSDLERSIEQDKAAGLTPWVVFASAGTINTGSVDPLAEIVKITKPQDIWLHVDAAYGGAFILTQEGKKTLRGLSEADSVVFDPHKGLFQPYGIGAALVADGEKLRKSMSFSGDYLVDVLNSRGRSPADYSSELTRHFRSLRLWFTLRLHGVQALRDAIEEKLILTKYLHAQLGEQSALEIGPAPELSVVTFRHRDGDLATMALMDNILNNGQVHLSSTKLRGEVFMRVCIMNFRSHKAEVDQLLSVIQGNLRNES